MFPMEFHTTLLLHPSALKLTWLLDAQSNRILCWHPVQIHTVLAVMVATTYLCNSLGVAVYAIPTNCSVFPWERERALEMWNRRTHVICYAPELQIFLGIHLQSTSSTRGGLFQPLLSSKWSIMGMSHSTLWTSRISVALDFASILSRYPNILRQETNSSALRDHVKFKE